MCSLTVIIKNKISVGDRFRKTILSFFFLKKLAEVRLHFNFLFFYILMKFFEQVKR